jgi:hypothetical protein
MVAFHLDSLERSPKLTFLLRADPSAAGKLTAAPLNLKQMKETILI